MTAAPGPEARDVVAWSDTSLRDLGAGPWGSVAGTEDIAGVAAALAASGAAVLEALDPESAHEALEVRGESPWDRLRAVVRNAGRTPVGVAISGRSLLGGRPVAPDLVRRFVYCAAESGAARVRAFDALNDADGLAPAAEAAAAAGMAFVPTLMVGPVPGPAEARWTEEARALVALPGVAAICVADKAGHLPPTALAGLVAAVAEATGVPVEVAVRAPGGLAALSSTEAVAAGAAAVEAAVGPMALAASRPSVETLRAALAGRSRVLECDADAVDAVARMLGAILPADRLRQSVEVAYGPVVALPPELAAGVAARLSRLGVTLSLVEVADETARLLAEAGGLTLAQPLGDAVVSQAVRHLVEGRRWADVEPVLAEVVLGRAGRLRGPVAPEARAGAEAAAPAPETPPDLDALARVAPDGLSEEDLVLWAQFPSAVERLLARRRSLGAEVGGPEVEPTVDRALIETLVGVVEAAGEAEVSVEVAGARITVRRAAPATDGGAAAPAEAADAGLARVESPMVGTFYRAPSPDAEPFVDEGQLVSAGQTLCLIEAMKLFNEIQAESDGVVREIVVQNAEPVEYGQLLFLLEPA